MLNLAKRVLLQNYPHWQKVQLAAIAYQFKVSTPFYYPDRSREARGPSQPQQQQSLVPEPQEPKNLPKDYYYRLLGVRKQASAQQIKAAYYTLAKRFHPDSSSNPQKCKQFQDISNAYHILTDENKRQEYDQLGIVRDEQAFLASVTSLKEIKDKPTANNNKVDDLVRMKIHGTPKLELTFIEAAHGLKKNIELRYFKKCPSCLGKSPNRVSNSTPQLCTLCGGSGTQTKATQSYRNVTACELCHGKRYIKRNGCELCENRGVVNEVVNVIVTIPAGVKNGDVISIENPKTKERINYRLSVKSSDFYRRDGNDVHSDKTLSISEAVFGGSFKIRGISSELLLRVEPGTQSHTKVVIKGQGLKTKDGRGNHVVTLKVRIPKILNMKQRQLMLAFAKTEESTSDNVD